MNEYIKNWKAEHVAIMDFLSSAVTLDICSEAGKEKLLKVKNMILRHLKNEDEVLYPMLKKAARNNVDMNKLMELLVKDMDELAPKVFAFFAEYEDNPMANGLSIELAKIGSLLKARIGKEEDILIKEYENIVDKSAKKIGCK